MASIGGFNFIRLRGGIHPVAEVPQEITRPNVDGHAFRRFGKRGMSSLWESVVDLTQANVSTTIAGYRALQGTLVTLVDEAGDSYTNVMVRSVRIGSVFAVTKAVGGLASGSNRYMLMATWEIQPTEVS